MEVGLWLSHLRVPVKGYYGQVWLTHERVANILNAVVGMSAHGCDADIVQVVPHQLPQHLQAVEMVVGTQLAVVSAAILQLERGAVQLPQLLLGEPDVVVFEDAAPRRFDFRTRLSSILGVPAETTIEVVLLEVDGFPCRCCSRQGQSPYMMVQVNIMGKRPLPRTVCLKRIVQTQRNPKIGRCYQKEAIRREEEKLDTPVSPSRTEVPLLLAVVRHPQCFIL